FSSRRRHTRFSRDWSSDVCSSDLSSQQLEALTSEQVDALNTAQIGALSSAAFAAMSTDELAVLDSADMAAINAKALSGFSTDSKIGRASCRERVERSEEAAEVQHT